MNQFHGRGGNHDVVSVAEVDYSVTCVAEIDNRSQSFTSIFRKNNFILVELRLVWFKQRLKIRARCHHYDPMDSKSGREYLMKYRTYKNSNTKWKITFLHLNRPRASDHASHPVRLNFFPNAPNVPWTTCSLLLRFKWIFNCYFGTTSITNYVDYYSSCSIYRSDRWTARSDSCIEMATLFDSDQITVNRVAVIYTSYLVCHNE